MLVASPKVIQISDAEQLVVFFVSEFGRKPGNRDFVFRGEAADYKSVFPPLDRVLKEHSSDWEHRLAIEAEVIARFYQDASAHLRDVERELLSNGYILSVMQHYGAPTRLLDWTESPWVALFFACSDRFDEDGRVLAFKRRDLTGCVHRLYSEQTKRVSEIVYINSVSPAIPVPGVLNPENVREIDEWLVCLDHRAPRFPRLTAQQGLFTLASKPAKDHWSLIQEHSGEGDVYEFVIRSNQKRSVLSHLRLMGIHAAALLPGIAGVAMNTGLLLGEKAFPYR